jgi:opacity protein-like surface antigen
MRRILTALAAAADMCAGTMASAAAITQFNKATRNGVFTLSQNQADYLGRPDARFIGLYYIREGNGTTSMLASHSTSRR